MDRKDLASGLCAAAPCAPRHDVHPNLALPSTTLSEKLASCCRRTSTSAQLLDCLAASPQHPEFCRDRGSKKPIRVAHSVPIRSKAKRLGTR